MSARPCICTRAGCGYVEDAPIGRHCDRPMRALTPAEYRALVRREKSKPAPEASR